MNAQLTIRGIVPAALCASLGMGCGDTAGGAGGGAATADDGGSAGAGANTGGQGGESDGGANAGGQGGAAGCAIGDQRPCYTGPPGTEGVGVCKSGTQYCKDDGTYHWKCFDEVVPLEESCLTPDDDNCDGAVNEGCVCSPGSDEPCYSGPTGTEGVGLCKAGTRTCNADGTALGPCEGEITPTPETCSNPGDEDCDGVPNEEGPDCTCMPGSVQTCYSAAPETIGVGPCVEGTQTCETGLGFGPCVGEVVPKPESCLTPVDDDCNGLVNDVPNGCCEPYSFYTCYTGPAGTAGVGACATGLAVCASDGTSLGPCFGEVLPAVETCNTPADDDCDGSANEEGVGCSCEANTTVACYTAAPATLGIGSCTSGTASCDESGALGACLGEITPRFDDCVTVEDEDCDGATAPCSAAHIWSHGYEHAGYENAGPMSVAVDPGKNVVVVGTMVGSTDFGGGLLPAQSYDAFVAKFDEAGHHVWSKNFGDAAFQGATSVATDALGNVVVVGSFAGNIDFGGGNLFYVNNMNGFIVKLDAAGHHLWSKRFGPMGNSHGYSVSVDDQGDIVVVGGCPANIDLGSGPLPCSGADVFVAKLAGDGGLLWSKQFDINVAYNLPYIPHVATGPLGAVVLTGQAKATTDFGGGPVGSAGVFVAGFDSSGNYAFSRVVPGVVESKGIAIAPNGDIAVTGMLYGTADFGGGPVTATGNHDAFLIRYDAAGNHIWSKHFGYPLTGDSWGNAVAFDGAGNAVLAAKHGGVFAAKLTPTGEEVWKRTFGGSDAAGVAIDDSGAVVLTGSFYGTTTFGGAPLTATYFSALFLAKLAP